MPSPRRIQSAKYRIVLLVVTSLALLSEFVYLLSGGAWLEPKVYLRTYLPDSAGLDDGATVELHGVEIGTVESLRLTMVKDRTRSVEARLKIRASFLRNIPEDSITSIDSETMLGDNYINITMGKSPRPAEPGGELRFRPPSDFLKSIDLQQFDAQLKTIDQILIDAQAGKGNLGEFFNSDRIYRNVLTRVSVLDRKLKDASGTTSSLGGMLYSSKMIDQITDSLRQLDDQLAKLQASAYMRDSKQYDQIRDQLVKLREALPKGKMFTSDEDYVAWNKRVAALIESVDSLNSGEGEIGQMLVNAQTYESLAGSMRQIGTTVKEFREDPQKFLRLKLF